MAIDQATFRDFERHFWLARSMARAVGVNLTDAMAQHRLTPDEYAAMVETCCAGDCCEPCQRWLGAQTGARPVGAPDYCPLRDILTGLM